MFAKFMADSGLIYRTATEKLDDEYIEISQSDYELYATLDYAYDFATGTPRKLVVIEQTLQELKQIKLKEIDAWTAKKITGGFISSCNNQTVMYDSDKDTQLTMQGICLNVQTPLFAEKYPTGCPVRGYSVVGGVAETEKQVFMLTAEQVQRWCADLSIHIGTCKQLGWQKQGEVNACATKEQLNAIVLE